MSCDISHLSIEENTEKQRLMKCWIDNEDTMLTARHIYNGRSRWKEELSADELELVELIAGDWLEKYGYKRRL